MTTIFLLLAAAAAAPNPTPWPTEGPVIYRFTYAFAGGFTNSMGAQLVGASPVTTITWTCTVQPPRRNGRQERLCVEKGLGDVWILWGPGRQILQLDIDEEKSDLGDDRFVHRANILAGALELWPPVAVVGKKWEQRGRFGVLKPAPNTTSSSFVLGHSIASVDGTRATISSTGGGTLLIGASSANTESRVEFGAVGDAVFDTATGLLLERRVGVYPTRVLFGTAGTLGHAVTATLVYPPTSAAGPGSP